jgi:predicted DNA-binding antitoxin AbrB/MazE fold protein
MSKSTCDAIYENGIFRPINTEELNISEGQKVRIIIETEITPEEILKLAKSVYEGLTEEEINEVEKIALKRGDMFAK